LTATSTWLPAVSGRLGYLQLNRGGEFNRISFEADYLRAEQAPPVKTWNNSIQTS
jgi:hypothetical protein